MEKIQNIEELRDGILELRARQDFELALLKEQFRVTKEGLKPINLIKGAFSKILSTPNIKSTVVTSVVGLTAGFLVTRLFTKNTRNPLTRLIIGSIAGMTTVTNALKAIRGISKTRGSLKE